MSKQQQVAQLAQEAYQHGPTEVGSWLGTNHVPVVADEAKRLAEKYQADLDLTVAGAWLHDFGDAFIERHDPNFDQISFKKAHQVLKQAGYSQADINFIWQEVIIPHPCREVLPTTLEGKLMATADAIAHLDTDFLLNFAWKHIPQGKNLSQFRQWVAEKLERDFHTRIFFQEEQDQLRSRYEALKEVFVKRK